MDTQLNNGALAGAIRQIRNRYDELSNREQRLVLLMALVVALAVVWLVALAPAIDTLTATRANLADRQAQASRVVALADTVAAMREQGGSKGQNTAPAQDLLRSRLALMQWQDNARVEETAEGTFQVEIRAVPAVDALEWLDNTERLTGLTLKNLTIEKISTGTVNVRSQWARSGGGT